MKKHLVLLFLVFIGLSSCYKDDVANLYSKQYKLTNELININEKINSLNQDISTLQAWYIKLQNKTAVRGFKYRVKIEGDKVDTLGFDITIDTVSAFIPFGKNGKDGKDGKDGKNGTNGTNGANGTTPTISINQEGYWVINGVATTYKAVPENGVNGKDGKDGKDGTNGLTPEISAKKDTLNLSDPNYYWVIKFPNSPKWNYIIVDGHKLMANGTKGDKGDKGEQGPKGEQGDTPTVAPVIESVTQAQDGTAIIITTFDKKTYTIPLLSLEFKLKLEEVDGLQAHNTIAFSMPGETISIPYTSSNSVEHIQSMLPAGWSAKAVINPTDPTKRVINITAPSMADIEYAVFDGGASFIAFDQKGASVSQFCNIKLDKKIFYSYFYNPKEVINTGIPTSPENLLKYCINDKTAIITKSYIFNPNTNLFDEPPFVIVGGNFQSNVTLPLNVLGYPAYNVLKDDSLTNAYIRESSFIFNPENVRFVSLPTNEDNGMDPSLNDFCTPYIIGTSADQQIIYSAPVSEYTLASTKSFIVNSRCDNIINRMVQISVPYTIIIHNASTWFNQQHSFDYTKVKCALDYQYFFANATRQMTPTTYIADSKHCKYDDNTDILTIEFCTFGTINTGYTFKFYYNDQGVKIWDRKTGSKDMTGRDTSMELVLNKSQSPARGLRVMKDYYCITNDRTGRGIYATGEVKTLTEAFPIIVPLN